MAFRSFVATKGRPYVFYSDQAKTFKAADKQLRVLLSEGMHPVYDETYKRSNPIEWKFSTETAPWTNGVTERLVGLFKRQLKVLLQKHLLTLRQLDTLVKEITSSVNDRPLGAVTEGPDELAITPNLLQYGRTPNPLITPSTREMEKLPCSEMWVLRKKALANFWSRWQADYLNTLSVDKKWLSGDQTTMLKTGDVVILKPETLEKGQWRLARIVDVHKNLDGVVTSALVKLPSGVVYSRSMRQIALLEPSISEMEHHDVLHEERSGDLSPEHVENVRSEEGHAESDPDIPLIKDRGNRPRPDSSPCLNVPEQSSSTEYAEPSDTAKEDSGSGTTPKPPADLGQGPATTELRRGTRPRRRKGFYLKLHEGNL